MSDTKLKLIVRTPREVILETEVSSVRLPTETGQVGIRRQVEPMVLAVEPGLVLIRQARQLDSPAQRAGYFVATVKPQIY